MKGNNRHGLPGEWYQLGRDVYLVVNQGGTVEKLGRPAWWRVLVLAFANAFGKMTHVDDIKGFLFPRFHWSGK